MEGNVESATFVSCMHKMSGRAYSIHSCTRSKRAVREFTFHVAIRTNLSSGVHDHEEQLGLTGRLACHARSPVPRARPCRQPAECDLEVEHLTGSHLTPEPGPVDSPEEREPPRVPLVREQRDAAELGQGLHHEHARERGTTREVPGEERLLPRQAPAPTCGASGFELRHLVDEEERWSVWEDILGSLHARRG
jgi:hypothetical protein